MNTAVRMTARMTQRFPGRPSVRPSCSGREISLVVSPIVSGYMLAFACVLVTGGRLGDSYGRKRMFLWGLLGFTVASAVCGAAPDASALWWQVAVFALALFLCSRLPRLRVDEATP
jgi:MFS family permease